MNLGRLAFRSLLLIAVAALVAGCASRSPAESGAGEDPDTDTLPANETTGETPGCIEEGTTGSGNGDIAADNVCPGADDDNETATLP